MILHRFMSKREYDALMNGEVLRNYTDHAANGEVSESVGFCFFPEDPCDAIEWLSFLVDADYCVTVDIPADMVRESKGRYRDVAADEGNSLFDDIPMLWKKEYCTTEYSLSKVKVLAVTSDYAVFSRIPENASFLDKIERLRRAGEATMKRKERRLTDKKERRDSA